MPNFPDSRVARQAIAHATYTGDGFAGVLDAYLIPQRTRRGGQPATVYRWLDQRGFLCDGLRCGFGADRMIAHARYHAAFADVSLVAEG